MRPPVKVEVEGYEPHFVRVLTVRETRELLAKKEGEDRHDFPERLLRMAHCDEAGKPVPGNVQDLDYPLFTALANAARDLTFGKPDEGKADGTKGVDSSTS